MSPSEAWYYSDKKCLPQRSLNHTVHISIGGIVGDIVVKIEGILGQNNGHIWGISGQNRGLNQPKIRKTCILNKKQWESDKRIVEFL